MFGAVLDLQSVVETIEVNAAPDKVWDLIGQFGAYWHPLIAEIRLTGTGPGQLRAIETIDGKQIIERLDEIDPSGRFYRYTSLSGIPASNYTGALGVKPKGDGSVVGSWHPGGAAVAAGRQVKRHRSR